MEGPDDPAERIDALCALGRAPRALRARSRVVCLTGPLGGRSEEDGRRDRRRRAAAASHAVAREADVPLGVRADPPRSARVGSLRELARGRARAPRRGGAARRRAACSTRSTSGTTAPCWDTIARATYRIAGVHVSDWPADPERTDRELPGDGISRTKRARRCARCCRAGTARSTSRSSRPRTRFGRCRSTRRRARRTRRSQRSRERRSSRPHGALGLRRSGADRAAVPGAARGTISTRRSA